jgi:uncharacterized protein
MLNWSELLIATLSASLIGSLHCVGMCGPFAMIAMHSRSSDPVHGYSKTIGYHLGRLTTYVFLGTLVGIAGTLVNIAGQTMGLSQSAAKLVGVFMVVLGLIRLIGLILRHSKAVSHSQWLQRWTECILAIGKRMQPASPVHRAFVIGLVTTWLPCGWLYLFAIAAGSTGSVLSANALMIAFWVGTLPLLSIVALGSASLGRRSLDSRSQGKGIQGVLSRGAVQTIAACLMIAFGIYTYVHRAQIQLDSLVLSERNEGLSRASIRALTDESLPCCIEIGSVNEKESKPDRGKWTRKP